MCLAWVYAVADAPGVRPYERGIAYGNCSIDNRQMNRQLISPINGNT